jgi:hypothetical protein
MKGYKLVTLRSREHQPGHSGITHGGYDVVNAMPCQDCVIFLRNYGFRKIYYTDDVSKVTKVKVRDLQAHMHGLSDAQRVYKRERHLRSGQVMSLDPRKYLKDTK